MTLVVDRHGEGEPARVVADDEHRPGWNVFPRNQAVEVDQRQAFLHREAEAPVIGVIRVRAAVSVAQEVVRTEGVVVRSTGGGRDGERRAGQHARLEDALRSDERHAGSVQREPAGEQRPRQDVTVAVDLRLDPLEGRIPNRCVPVAIEHVTARRALCDARCGSPLAQPSRQVCRRSGRDATLSPD